MAVGEYARLSWVGDNYIDIVSADLSDNTFTVAGDMRRTFIQGVTFAVEETTLNDRSIPPYQVNTNSTYNANTDRTTIIVTPGVAVVADQGAEGFIKEGYEWIEFEWFDLNPADLSDPNYYKKDRKGRLHIQRPTAIADQQVKVNTVILAIHASDRDIFSNSGFSLPEVIYNECISTLPDSVTEFTLFHQKEFIRSGVTKIIKLAYKGRILLDPGIARVLGSSQVSDGLSGAVVPQVTLNCSDDGTFTYLGNPGSAHWRWA